MMIKANLYYPTQLQLPKNSTPMLFDVIKIKTVVLIWQLFYIVLQFKWLINGMDKQFNDLLPSIIMIALSVITFIAFHFEQKTIMRAHIWIVIIMSLIPVAIVELLIAYVFNRGVVVVFNREKIMSDESECLLAVLLLIFVISISLAVHAFYIWMCYELVKSIDNDATILPYYTQDSRHIINRHVDNISKDGKSNSSKF